MKLPEKILDTLTTFESTAEIIATDLLKDSKAFETATMLERSFPKIILYAIQSKYINLIAKQRFHHFKSLTENSTCVNSLAFNSNGKLFASGSDDGIIRIWETMDYKLIIKDQIHSKMVNSIAFSPTNNEIIAAASDNGCVKLFNILTKNITLLSEKHLYAVKSVAFSPTGETLALADGKKIALWDIKTQKLIATLNAHTNQVYSLAFDKDGKKLASGSRDKTIVVWDIATQTVDATFAEHQDLVGSLIFSPSGKLISGSMDATTKLWEIGPKKITCTLNKCDGPVRSINLHPDGKTLAIGLNNGKIYLSNMATDLIYAMPTQDTSSVNSVAFNPTGEMLASGSTNGIIDLWKSEQSFLESLTLTEVVIFFLAREKGIYTLGTEGKKIFNSLPESIQKMANPF